MQTSINNASILAPVYNHCEWLIEKDLEFFLQKSFVIHIAGPPLQKGDIFALPGVEKNGTGRYLKT